MYVVYVCSFYVCWFYDVLFYLWLLGQRWPNKEVQTIIQVCPLLSPRTGIIDANYEQIVSRAGWKFRSKSPIISDTPLATRCWGQRAYRSVIPYPSKHGLDSCMLSQRPQQQVRERLCTGSLTPVWRTGASNLINSKIFGFKTLFK